MPRHKQLKIVFENKFITNHNPKFVEELKEVWEKGIARSMVEKISKGQV